MAQDKENMSQSKSYYLSNNIVTSVSAHEMIMHRHYLDSHFQIERLGSGDLLDKM